MRHLLLLLTFASAMIVSTQPIDAKERVIKVVIWDEQQPSQKKAYPVFLGQYIADYLKRQPGLQVDSVSIDHPQKGLSDEVINNCDVLIWWGHVRNAQVKPEEVTKIIKRVKDGKMALLALHSAHWATPFVMAMHERAADDAIAALPAAQQANAKVEWVGKIVRRAPKRDAEISPKVVSTKIIDGVTVLTMTRPNCCFPAYRNHGKPSEITTVKPDHPIAHGIPKKFTLPHTEMYDEPYHVPAPDAVIFEENWEAGEHFRSGALWNVGKGKVFYFRPGHETHAVFTEKLPMQVIHNAVNWLGTQLDVRQ
jgi:trehalose utilization protein